MVNGQVVEPEHGSIMAKWGSSRQGTFSDRGRDQRLRVRRGGRKTLPVLVSADAFLCDPVMRVMAERLRAVNQLTVARPATDPGAPGQAVAPQGDLLRGAVNG